MKTKKKLNKNVKLKNGKVLTLTTPSIDNAQELADYYNTIVCQSRFVAADAMDTKLTAENETQWIEKSEKDERSLIIAAKLDGKIVGLGNISTKNPKYIRFKHSCGLGVSVLKDFWGLGIASAIMTELVEFARKASFEQIELDVVSTNESAVHLYKKFGFVEEGLLTHAMKYTDGTYADFIKMQKFLV